MTAIVRKEPCLHGMRRVMLAIAAFGALACFSTGHAQTYSRTDTLTYEDNLGLWVIGQPATSTNVNTGLLESAVEYDPATALPIRTYAFGKLKQTLQYYSGGTLKSTSDARDNGGFNTTIAFSTRLERKSVEAENSDINIHGVSASTSKPDGPCSGATCGDLESAGFKVHDTPTRADRNHKTIELPKPVTTEDAARFNRVMGRRRE